MIRNLPLVLATLALPVAADAETSLSEMPMPQLFGYFFAMNSGIDDLNFEGEEAEQFIAGFRTLFVEGTEYSQEELQEAMPKLQAYIQERVQAQQAAAVAGAREAETAYFEELKGQEGVLADPSGFYYEILEEGTGAMPVMTDTVEVNYEGKLLDGTVFDSSYERGSPATFPLQGVIPGFGGGLTKVAEGGKIRIHIPAALGYGDTARPGSPIPAGSTLVFEVELLEIQKAEAEEDAAGAEAEATATESAE